MSLSDLFQESNIDNAPGIVSIYAIEKDDVATFPSMNTEPAVNAEFIESTGNVSCVGGKYFVKIDITAGQVTLEEKTSGGPRQNSPMSTLKVKRAGISSSSLGWLKQAKNKELVVIAKDRNGLVRMLGDVDQGAFITEIDTKSGAKQGDERGTEFTIEYMGREAIVYTGIVPIND